MKFVLDTADVKTAIRNFMLKNGCVTDDTPMDIKIIKLKAADEISVEIDIQSAEANPQITPATKEMVNKAKAVKAAKAKAKASPKSKVTNEEVEAKQAAVDEMTKKEEAAKVKAAEAEQAKAAEEVVEPENVEPVEASELDPEQEETGAEDPVNPFVTG